MADQLLYGFDVSDAESREFLGSLVTSGRVSREDMKELFQLSLMRGVEEWEMLFECATSVKNENEARHCFNASASLGHEQSLVPFLEIVLSGQAEDKEPKPLAKVKAKGKRQTNNSFRRRHLAKNASRFWAGPEGEDDEDPKDGGRDTDRRNTGLVTLPALCYQEAGGEEIAVSAAGPSSSMRGAQLGLDPTIALERERERGANGSQNDSSTSMSNLATPQPLELNSDQQQGMRRRSPRVRAKQAGNSSSGFFRDPEPTQNTDDTQAVPPTSKKTRLPPRITVSRRPIPRLSTERFGLIQEKLAHDPFRLLIAVTFLIRTAGRTAIPVFRELMDRFPTPEALVAATPGDIISMIHPLGLSVVRCSVIQKYARIWLERPPTRHTRYGVKNYPRAKIDGRHVRAGEEFGPEDVLDGNLENDAVADARKRALGCAWEIGHMTQGRYALDSWRIFCRDVLLGRADDWKGRGAKSPDFQPEWMRVLPEDKELRACLRWMWMREGWEWDPITGERQVLGEEMRTAVDEGRVGYDNRGNLVMSDKTPESDSAG
ncbi:hypothetical protein QBC46DRAFT_114809 [Diplogelasinospora grovesii]|uniref:HhH-GPD domain-containing protein n=1 Tax=Diplogelasinospora grovesii TaxID=303347 RepID=A0AAN6NGV0_9PEZI|nr:hypothetical protein QBC46DRAFT_114809 [Diplogelasinospora grovesii]